MPSNARRAAGAGAIGLLAAMPALAADPPATDAPPEVVAAGAAGATAGMGEGRYDAVGLAGAAGRPDLPAITVAHRTLPPGSTVEVTALDSGRTILARVAGAAPAASGSEIDLSRGAADLLGVSGGAVPVRVRLVVAGPADAAALDAGRAAATRLDAPPALLIALRRRVPAAQAPAAAASVPPAPSPAPPARPALPRRAPVSVPSAGGAGLLVQVAAVADEARARALARSLGGSVQPAGALWRVRLGPFADRISAQRARDAVARRGYGDARIVVR